MDELVKSIFAAPLATILIVAGVIFLFIAVVGNISGKIEPGAKGRVISGILGLAFIAIGLFMHFMQKAADTEALTVAPQAKKEPDRIAQASPKPKERETTGKAPVPMSGTEEEPNDVSPSANPITIGTTVRGRVKTVQDRDMFKFRTGPEARVIRVILRKLSATGYFASTAVYDAAEQQIIADSKRSDTPISLSFESASNSDYYVAVKCYEYIPCSQNNDYELTVREEKLE